MLEKPDIPEALILARLRDVFGLPAVQVTFLPLGADVNTAVYRVTDRDGTPYFLKLRKGDFAEISVAVPHFLKALGIQAIIPPLETRSGALWGSLDPYNMILYPFVEGRDGYEAALSDRQWIEFGAALRAVHATELPPALARQIPREEYSPRWRDKVRSFQAQVEHTTYTDPTAAKTAAFVREQRETISRMVERADQLACALRARRLDCVLCHSDLHPGNLHITPGPLYLVDWDNPTFAPIERDLLLIGGTPAWTGAHVESLFYQGYGPADVDREALAYYRYERVIQDVAEFCEQLLLTDEGGEDREQSYRYFTGSFLPGHEADLAFQADPN